MKESEEVHLVNVNIKTEIYIATTDDERNPPDCDIAGSPKEGEIKSIQEQESRPDKHPAIMARGETASICRDCHMIRCNDCACEYDSSTPNTETAFDANFPSLLLKEGLAPSSRSKFTHDSNSEYNNSEDGGVALSLKSSESGNSEDGGVALSPSSNTEQLPENFDENKRSNIDDFADPSQEMPDYID